MENLQSSLPNTNISKIANRGDNKPPTEGGAMEGATWSACDARHASQDCSRERATAMDKLITDALARNNAELTVKFTALLKNKSQ